MDREVAENYGMIKNNLCKKGRPIPENDIWIAAIAQTYDLELVTRDEHFAAVEELVRHHW